MTSATLEVFPIADFTKEQTITLSDRRLKEFWEAGALSDLAYITMLLGFEDPNKPIYPDVLCVKWRGSTDDKGKAKELTPVKIERALLTLREKGIIGIQSKPIQLSFSLWADGYTEAE
jgi:hypothetical protein